MYSFVKHHAGWEMYLYSAGAHPTFLQIVPQGTTIVQSVANDYFNGLFIPTSKARLTLLSELPTADSVVLYLDSDTVVMGSIEPIVERLLSFNLPLAIQPELPAFYRGLYASGAWKDWKVPSIYKNVPSWHNKVLLNSGFMVCNGTKVGDLCSRSLTVFDELYPQAMWGEQSFVTSDVYDTGTEFMSLSESEHCIDQEKFVKHAGRPYIDPCYYDGKQIIVRHFCGSWNKPPMEAYMNTLTEYYVGKGIDPSAWA